MAEYIDYDEPIQYALGEPARRHGVRRVVDAGDGCACGRVWLFFCCFNSPAWVPWGLLWLSR